MEVICYTPDSKGKYNEHYREYNLLKSVVMDCEIRLKDE